MKWKKRENKREKETRMKKWLVIFFCAILCCMTACAKGNTQSQEYEKTEELLGTIITGKVYGENAEEGLKQAFKRVEEIEDIMSAKEADSELSMVNREACQREVQVSEELYDVMEKAVYYARLTDGAFDPTIGKLINLWGIGTEHEKVPADEELKALAGLKDYEQIVLNKEKKTVHFLTDTIQLDLGGIAKGYAADEMKKVLTDTYGITSGILSLGGNVITIGNKPNGEQWMIGIADPLQPSEMIGTLSKADKTIVTSGNYERYFIKDNKRYHHILNPATGYPAENGMISSTIIADCSMDADALSTATYVMGVDAALELVEKTDGVEAVFVKDDGSIVTTEGADFSQKD